MDIQQWIVKSTWHECLVHTIGCPDQYPAPDTSTVPLMVSLIYEFLKNAISIGSWWKIGTELFFCVLGLDVVPEQPCSLLDSPVAQSF